jgi:hypothetical protein
MAILKAKGDTPICAYRHCPTTLAVAFERVQAKGRLLHILHVARLVERGEDQTEPVDLIGSNPAAVILFKQAAQALMPKAFDHPLRM